MKRKVIFIVNPIAGGKNKIHFPDMVKKELDAQLFDFDVVFTEAPEHATHLSAAAEAQGYDIAVAVGGDGTMSEVARGIIHTNVALGIVPYGSGNGLGRMLGIPSDVVKSIRHMNKARVQRIDTATLNGKSFCNMAGTGFDAHIGKVFSEQTERGFKTYVANTLREWRQYRAMQYRMYIDGREVNVEGFLVSFANSTQYGNNAHIAPHASVTDGEIDITILKPFPTTAFPSLALRLFNKTIDKSRYVDVYRGKVIQIERERNGAVHLDGEPYSMDTHLEVRVVPASLSVLS